MRSEKEEDKIIIELDRLRAETLETAIDKAIGDLYASFFTERRTAYDKWTESPYRYIVANLKSVLYQLQKQGIDNSVYGERG
jgi:hypothetical protein